MQTLAVISGDNLLSAVISLVVLGVIYFILNWGISRIALPEPFAKIASVILILFVVIGLINIVLTIAGHPWVKLW